MALALALAPLAPLEVKSVNIFTHLSGLHIVTHDIYTYLHIFTPTYTFEAFFFSAA